MIGSGALTKEIAGDLAHTGFDALDDDALLWQCRTDTAGFRACRSEFHTRDRRRHLALGASVGA